MELVNEASRNLAVVYEEEFIQQLVSHTELKLRNFWKATTCAKFFPFYEVAMTIRVSHQAVFYGFIFHFVDNLKEENIPMDVKAKYRS